MISEAFMSSNSGIYSLYFDFRKKLIINTVNI